MTANPTIILSRAVLSGKEPAVPRSPVENIATTAIGRPFSVRFGKYDLIRVNPSPSDQFTKINGPRRVREV